MKAKNTTKQYALYRGDDFIMIGTLAEIAKKLGVNEQTVKFYGTPTYYRRTNGNGYVLVEAE